MIAYELYNEDCFETFKRLADHSVDMILCDPPYGTTACKWDTIIPLEPMWRELRRIAKPTAVMAFCASQPFTSVLVTSNIAMYRHEWIWIKNRGSNFANTVREPMKEHESILIFSAGKWTYNKQMQERTGGGLDRVKYNVKFETSSQCYREFDIREENKLPDLRVPSSWQKFNTEVGLHPTQKPVALMEYLIKTYTEEGQTVLDFAAGSFTTGVACLNTGRSFIGTDLDFDYFRIGASRMKKRMQELVCSPSSCDTTGTNTLNLIIHSQLPEFQNSEMA